jgi:hypothetical protein
MVAVQDARVEPFLTLPKEYPQITRISQIKNKEKERRVRTGTILALSRCRFGISGFSCFCVICVICGFTQRLK